MFLLCVVHSTLPLILVHCSFSILLSSTPALLNPTEAYVWNWDKFPENCILMQDCYPTSRVKSAIQTLVPTIILSTNSRWRLQSAHFLRKDNEEEEDFVDCIRKWKHSNYNENYLFISQMESFNECINKFSPLKMITRINPTWHKNHHIIIIRLTENIHFFSHICMKYA